MEKRQVEILAPAGSFDSMKAAVAAGADAVYMGGSRFGARAYADNPDEKGLLEAIDYVHLHGRRLYMTVNTLFKEDELEELENYMRPYYDRGLDGVIAVSYTHLDVYKRQVMRDFLSDPLLWFPYLIIRAVDGKNDGLVTPESAMWGEFKGTIANRKHRGISHGDMIDLKREDYKGFDVTEFYVELVKTLKEKGF